MLRNIAACVVVPLLLVLWSSRGKLRRSPWPAVAVILWYGYTLGRVAADNVRTPHEWDYACFWLYGHIAAAHLNLYDPAVFAHFASPFTPSDQFRAAVLNVGFPYPPPSIALFLPLGYIDNVSGGLARWYAVQFAALAGAAWVLARSFFPADGPPAALLTLALVLALPASQMNVGDAQLNFLLLLLVALALRGRGNVAGAVWQTLAIWVKPYTAVLVLLDLLRPSGRRLIAIATTVLLSLAAATLIGGVQLMSAYVRSNPAAREPTFAFVEVVNQSLLAVVLRTHAALPAHVAALHEPLYLAAALILTAVTLALCARTAKTNEAAFGMMLLLGLLVYPGTLSSYGVISVVPLLILWKHRARFPGTGASVAILAGLAVLLQSGPLQRGFEANLILWIASGYLLIAQRGEARRSSAAATALPEAQSAEAG